MASRTLSVLIAGLVSTSFAAIPASADFSPGGTVDLGSEFLQHTDGAAAQDLLAYEGSSAGAGAASAGDVNGDGFPDLIIGSYGADNNGRSGSGSAYIRFGPVTPGVVSLANPAAPPGIRIDGAAPGEQAGWVVNGAGDFNGDGLGDVLLGAPSVGGSSPPRRRRLHRLRPRDPGHYRPRLAGRRGSRAARPSRCLQRGLLG